jgi:hypothetical protein
MIARVLPPNHTLTDRFGHLLYWLFEGMAQDWRRRGVTHVHAAEISLRVVGLWKRVHSVLEKWRAGTLRAPGGRANHPHPGPPPQERERGRAERVVPSWSVLPRGFGWLRTLLLPESVYHVNAFYPLLNEDAEMQALIAAAPAQIGRVLRPFCHFLGLAVPAELRLPKRVRVRKSDPSPQPSPTRGEEEKEKRRRRRTPREIAEALVRRSDATGNPIDFRKVSSVVLGYILHPPRDDNCPPPKIGYGGRRWRPPKDYEPPRDWD